MLTTFVIRLVKIKREGGGKGREARKEGRSGIGERQGSREGRRVEGRKVGGRREEEREREMEGIINFDDYLMLVFTLYVYKVEQ